MSAPNVVCVLLGMLLMSAVQAVDDEHAELCRLFKNSTQLRKPGSCNEYIECAGDHGEVRSCNTPKLFDAAKSSCVDSIAGKEYCNNPCDGLTNTWVSDPTSCHGFLYCQDSQPLQGYCPNNLHFDEKLKMCIFSDSSNCLNVANICALVPDKTKFRNENDCSTYYECSKGVHTLKSCAKNTYFQVETGNCVKKSLVPCTAHPIPKDICLETKGTTKKPSPGLKDDQATCRGFFHCKDLGIVHDIEPIWYQCPPGQFFSEELKGCTDPINAVCEFNRCESRGTMMVTSSSNDCHNYIRCVDGVEVEEVECPIDMFFDERYQACVNHIIDHKCCDGRK